MMAAGIYYVVWMRLVPKWRGYRIRAEISLVDDNGATTHRLVRVPVAELARWDAEHDETGQTLNITATV